MTAYEFTKLVYSPHKVNSMKIKYGGPHEVAKKIESGMKVNLRENSKYEEAKDMFIELSMSCNCVEAKKWMTYWMLSALVYKEETNDLDWRLFFLGAYDIFLDLSEE